MSGHLSDRIGPRRTGPSIILFFIGLIVLIGATVTASRVQEDFGRVAVSNVIYPNWNGIPIRAKLLKPVEASAANPLPGIVYIHGYQNNRETSDAYCIELARRGFVVLNIDAIGRGNSGIPGRDPKAPGFDLTYGGTSSLAYLKSLPCVKADSVGMMGHSLGAEMAYTVALKDPSVSALAFSGFAWTLEATPSSPKNMLMIIGRWDEYRKRMTGTQDIEKEWMSSPRTRRAIPEPNPQIGSTYGDFAIGTARRVFVPRTVHLLESHNRSAIAEALLWMKTALHPPDSLWIDPARQIWPIKEWATLIAMLAGVALLLPLAQLLLGLPLFGSLRGEPSLRPVCTTAAFLKYGAINGLLMWLYLPLIFLLFGLHVYVVKIDGIFPLMMANGILWWFFAINAIGFFILRAWFRRKRRETGITWADMGASLATGDDTIGKPLGKTILLAAILFAFAYWAEYLLEQFFIVDWRFLYPFASDLTPHRALLCLLYYPFLLIGFLQTGLFLHGQMRMKEGVSPLGTFVKWSLANTAVLVIPLVLFLMVQYVPLFLTGAIPFVGPGGMLANFVMALPHVIGVLAMVVPLSTWCFQLTGRIYLGALLNAALVTWMFISSQVIAPIPV